MHLWHGLPLDDTFPKQFPVVIEVPKGSSIKYELDKNTGLIAVDRILYGAMHYPLNYGFIPRTYCKDKDPIDVFIVGEYSLIPGCMMQARPIGYTKMTDEGEEDDKIIAVPLNDPELMHIKDIEDISPHLIKKIENFLATYKKLQNKEVTIRGTHGRTQALEVLKIAAESYQQNKSELLPPTR